MSQPAPPQLDLPSAVAALLVIWVQVSQPAADIVAHYGVIVVSALIGGAWSLGNRPNPLVWWRAMLFLALVSGTAAVLTTGLATVVAHWLPGEQKGINWIVGPVAISIGAIGHRWPDVGRWLIGRVGRRIDARIDGGRE
jgi:hypothetical protein